MSTQLQIVNNVLRRLREDTVTSVADNAYSQLIAEWVNEGMREVQEAYDWRLLDKNVYFDTVVGQDVYDLSATVDTTGAVDSGGNVTNRYSVLRFDDINNLPLAMSYDNWPTDKQGDQMYLINDHTRSRRLLYDIDEQVEGPLGFSLYQNAAGGVECALANKASDVRKILMVFNIPQEPLAIDGTDNATEIEVPVAPVITYTHLMASNERGEEIGEPGNLLERRYIMALGAAIEAAASHDIRGNRYESWRD